MVLIAVTCPYCQSDHIAKRGRQATLSMPKHRLLSLIFPAQPGL